MYGGGGRPDRSEPAPAAGFRALRFRNRPKRETAVRTDAAAAGGADHAPMHATPALDTTPRELCRRSNDGIEVTLWWLPGEDGLQVAVVDTKLNQSFQLPVDSDRAMQVFDHPYLYAPDHAIHIPADAERSPAWTVD
jgi:hypothetical protein